MTQPAALNLVDFPEYDVDVQLTSPRSLRACAKEGVEPLMLVYKPLETFAEKNLSPRLVKLRYDFFEAKRKDLLTACRRARSQLMAKEDARRGTQAEAKASMDASMVAAASALESDTIRLEKHKLARVQALERRWLESALGAELEALRKLEEGSQQAAQEASDDAAREREEADRRHAESERKKEQEHQRALEQKAQLQLERQLAREEFRKEQEMLEKKKIAEAKRKRERAAQERKEAEQKVLAEQAKRDAQERAFQVQQERIAEMERADAERRMLFLEQKAARDAVVEQRRNAQKNKIQQSVENNEALERQRELEFQNKLALNKERMYRLEEERRAHQEGTAKRSLQAMLKRRHIADEANRINEGKRNNLLEHQEEVEHRLMEHEHKKQRYLEFKRELDQLKEKNKLMNVERTRRRNEFRRESVAEMCRNKTAKADMTVIERQRLWDERRATAMASQNARDHVRGLILKQKIESRFDTMQARELVGQIFTDPKFNPKLNQDEHSQSMPNLPRI